MNENLKPCPFCGNNPDVVLDILYDPDGCRHTFAVVKCQKCWCAAGRFCLGSDEPIYPSYLKAIESWNKRT